jgi:hypothetical protein
LAVAAAEKEPPVQTNEVMVAVVVPPPPPDPEESDLVQADKKSMEAMIKYMEMFLLLVMRCCF